MATVTKIEYENLTGKQKAAILVLSLGEEQSGRILREMSEDEIQDISTAAALLGTVPSDVIEKLLAAFAESLGNNGGLIGNYDATERLLLRALPPDRVEQIMEELRGPTGRTMWDKLGHVNEAVLANYLKDEYPQTVAVVLSKIVPGHAARVLALLPEGFATEVVMRMLRMENVKKEILDGMERTLRTEFMNNLARGTRRDAHEMMAEIFNNLDRRSEARFITAIEERNKESAERIRALMFTFDDLKRLSGPDIQVLLRNIEKDKLPMALKGASEAVRDLFLRNLSERAGKMLRQDMEALGPVKLRDVDEAQTAIVATAKELAAQGEIEISESGSDEMVL